MSGLRTKAWFGLIITSFIALPGCNSIEGYPVRWPWSTESMLAEKYVEPPSNDSRYTDPMSFPKHTMVPKIKEEESLPGRPSSRPSGTRLGGPLGAAAGGY